MADPTGLPDSIHQATIDGVTVLWAPAPGPVQGALIFRVGVSDEPIIRRGVSHVVEHLALYPLGHVPYRIGGYVDHVRTGFTVEGRGPEVVAYLDAVTTNLHAPPFKRLKDELRVLQNEEQGRASDITNDLLWLRYGAEGPGRMWYGEFG